jgi:hypothetical protein
MLFDASPNDSVLLADLRQLVNPLEIEVKLEGQKVENNRVKVGCRAGPSCNFSNLLHEISHFIEIDKKRTIKNGWGLKYGLKVINPYPNRYTPAVFYEPQTDQQVWREIRVWAIQYNLAKRANIKENFEDLAESSVYLPAFPLFAKGLSDKAGIAKVAQEIEKLSSCQSYSLESILSQLETKKLYLKNYYAKH